MKYRQRGAVILAGVLLAGCAVPPEGTSQDDVAKFEAAVTSVGCQLVSEAEYLPVELQTGLSRQQTTKLASYMVASKRAVRLSTGGIRLTTGQCELQPLTS